MKDGLNEEDSEQQIKSSLYDKTITCPVCNNIFKTKAVKSSTIRIASKDSDTFIRYTSCNPYFYNVWICPNCGYANMEADFFKIKKHQKELVLKEITPKWKDRTYPEIYDVDIAIERFKLSLCNSLVYQADSSKKAMNYLKIAWMYRLNNDTECEKILLNQALEEFNYAYINEEFPIYGMNQPTLMYLIGELYRRLNKNDDALNWFSKLITMPRADQRIKDIARDQRDLIKNSTSTNKDISLEDTTSEISSKKTKKKLFSKLFK